MNKEDIIRMAREATKEAPREDWNSTAWVFGDETLERFAALVASAEREACAKVCDFRARSYSNETDMWAYEHVREAKICATAIRARGQS